MRKGIVFTGLAMMAAALPLSGFDASVVQGTERGHSCVSASLPGGEDAVRFCWDKTKSGYGEIVFPDPVKVEFPLPLRVKVHALAPAAAAAVIETVRLRLRDSRGETFQFDTVKPGFASGELEFSVDPRNVHDCWGGDGNRVIDGEARLTGFAIGFKGVASSGELTLGMPREFALSGPGVMFRLGGAGDLSVIRPGEEEELTLDVTDRTGNTRPISVECTFTDYFDRSFTVTGKAELAAEKTYSLPFGRKFPAPGYYRLDCRVKTPQGESRFERSLAVMTPSGPTPGRASGFLFGVHAHPHRSNMHDKRLEAKAAGLAGIKVVRADAHWRSIQPDSPKQWNFRLFDETVNVYAEQNIEVAVLLGAPPGWAKKPGWTKLRPEFRGEVRPANAPYCEYLRRLAERYRGRIRFYEQFNEPDLAVFYNFSADDYVDLFNEGADVIRKSDPDAVILTGGFATVRVVSCTNSPDYLEKALAGTKGKFDIHAQHEHGSFEDYRQRIDGPFRALREKLGISGVPWYSNETAVTAAGGREKNQAAELWRKLLFAWSRGAIGYNWYDLRNDGFDPNNGEHNFGLLTRDFQPKPVYVAYNTLTGLFSGMRFVRQLDTGLGCWLFEFADGDDRVLAGWLDPGSRSTTLLFRTNAERGEKIDLMGERSPVAVVDGLLKFDLGEVPSALRLPANAECKPAGRLIELKNSGAIRPGKPFCFELVAHNPFGNVAELTIRPETLRGITFDRTEERVRIPAGAEKHIAITGRIAGDFRIPPGEHSQLQLNYRFGECGGMVTFPLAVPVMIPSERKEHFPDFRIADRKANFNLVGYNPAQQHLVWRGPEDLSADIRLGLRGGKLIVEVAAVDDCHAQAFHGGEIWRGDSIQFALCVPDRSGFWEIGAAHLDDGRSELYVWSAPDGIEPNRGLRSFRAETRRAGNVTTYRVIMPLRELGLIERGLNSDGIRFNLLVNDNDGEGREGWMQIAPGIGTDKSPELFPVVVFEK